MVLQAYIDESTDESGTFVLAGYISTAERWAHFSAEWEKMLPLATLNESGDYHFKMHEMATSAERMARVAGFHNIINRHALCSISCVIKEQDHQAARNRLYLPPEIGTVVWKGTIYGLCYMLLMNGFHNARLNRPELFPFDGPVDFYFDERSEKADILMYWERYTSTASTKLRSLYGSQPRFEDDRIFLPLQAADFRAWWIRKWAQERGPENVLEGTLPFGGAAEPIKHIALHASEDQIVEHLQNNFAHQYEGVRLHDLGPKEDHIIEQFPAQKVGAYIMRLFGRRGRS